MSKFSDSGACACDEKPASNLSNGSSNGEEQTLEAIEKFRKFYEDKLRQIDIDGRGDCTELKLKLQERWIKDLTEQTEMMARVVKELEEEATTRVRMLEDKLKQTSKAAYEVMKRYQTYNITHNLDEPFQKVFYMENDLKNVLEFIRRVREDGKWNIDGLRFYDVTYEDLFGKNKCEENCPEAPSLSNFFNGIHSEKEDAPPAENENKPPDYEELLRKKDQEYEVLRQSMLDMRSALTEEVACKHDMILALKKDVLQLEERCVQADKQTAFKDDIIKELRKEIKQLKQQRNVPFESPRVSGSKIVLTTIKHSNKTEEPKCSTVIFIKDSENKEKIERKSKVMEGIDENKLLRGSYWKDVPVKEKSKFTVTDLNKTY